MNIPDQPRRNVELKARLDSLDVARDTARRVATNYLGIQHQIDTYFGCPNGRLKLREMNADRAQLIWYARADQAEARKSDYYLLLREADIRLNPSRPGTKDLHPGR